MDRDALINLAVQAKAKIPPMECYFIDTADGRYIVSLGNRPPKAFVMTVDGGKEPFDLDVVFEIKGKENLPICENHSPGHFCQKLL